MANNIKTPKKLIEVALPLDDINEACAYEKLPGIGPHPRGIHHWWARRPLAAARAVLFAQLVNDPGYERQFQRGINKEAAQKERERLFGIIRRLVKWGNYNNEEVLREAREEIWKSWRETCELNKGVKGFDPEQLPVFHDPFSGGGAIPLEAQQLGLESNATDLNPVAVMINKAMVEIPPLFGRGTPVNPESRLIVTIDERKGSSGLAEDLRYYGAIIRKKAIGKIGELYPEADLPKELGGGKGKVIAWIWARTVKSPNPAYSHVQVPLVTNYYLSTKKGKEVYICPVVEGENYRFVIKTGKPENYSDLKNGSKLARGANFKCLVSGVPITSEYIRSEGKAGRMGVVLLAMVVEGKSGRVYLPPTEQHQDALKIEKPEWLPNQDLPSNPRWFSPPEYGMRQYTDLFTNRQLVALTTLTELITEIQEVIYQDALSSGLSKDETPLNEGGSGARAYAEALAVYLAFSVERAVDFNNSLTGWNPSNEKIMHLFNRHAIPMVWDFGEANILEDVVGGWSTLIDYQSKCIEKVPAIGKGQAFQLDAATSGINNAIISTDPPYYDNIGYADLSDFFYVWLRKMLKGVYPKLFATLISPKDEELVATPYRHGGKEAAELFFLDGMTKAVRNMANNANPAFPITIYYAFKQSETKETGTVSTGWVTFLEAILNAGLSISGTWPMRSEQSTRMIAMDTNALASSIVLVCRVRNVNASTISRRSFIRELNETLPDALQTMIGGKIDISPIAAVDLQQASIGPGMEIFSKYAAVLEADGSTMAVRTALQLINRVVDAYLNTSEGDIDSDTLFCLTWFDQYAWKIGEYGQAEVLATAKGTTVDGLRNAGVLSAAHGDVRLLKWQEYPSEWQPDRDNRTPVWEALHQITRALQQQGEQAAGVLLAGMPARSEAIRNLAYRLFTLCERKGWSEDARAYNELIASWDAIDDASNEIGHHGTQLELF